MYCGRCGTKIIDNDNFCRNCGAKVENTTDDNNIKNNNTVIDEKDYTIAQKESSISIIFRLIGFLMMCMLCAFMHFVGNPPAFLSACSVIIGLGVVLLFILLSNKAQIGDCPYCKTKVKSPNKAGFICPRCRKNIAVNGNKFMKIKD